MVCLPHREEYTIQQGGKEAAKNGDSGEGILYVDVHVHDAAVPLPDHAFVCVKTPAH